MPTLVTTPLSRRYSAPLCSAACLAAVVVGAAALLLPLVLAYSSGAFWKKENSYREQPRVAFKHSLFVLVEGMSTRTSTSPSPFQLAWCTDTLFDQLVSRTARVPVVKTADVDENRDGKNDYLAFTIAMPAFAGEDILRLRIGFVFQYALETFVRISMETMGYLDYSSPLPGSKLSVQGDLRLVQRRNFPNRIMEVGLYGPVFNMSRLDSTAWTIEGIVGEYMERDVRTDLVVPYPIWRSGRGPSEPFVVTGKIRYPNDRIYYVPGLLEELKHGWIQYLSFLLITILLAAMSLTFLVQNRLVPTRVTVDCVPARTAGGPPKLHQF